MKTIKLEIIKKDGNFVVQDNEHEAVYGPPVATKKEAEELLKDWKAYFAAPMTADE